MKYDDTKKITALGVVIFSFVSLAVAFAIILGLDALTALLVLKTALPESFLQIGSVIGNGAGVIIGCAFLTKKGKIKGIYASLIMFFMMALVKIIGNALLGFGGYFTFEGVIGLLFTAVFALVGGVVGSAIKK